MANASYDNILLVGGGNAVHVLAGMAASNPKYTVSVLSLWAGEAARFEENSKENGLTVKTDKGLLIKGRPSKFTDTPSEVVPDAQLIIFAVPANLHCQYLEAIAPYVKPGTLIGSMPGQGGFDLCARDALGDDLFKQCTIFATETLPWACRIVDYGSLVEVLGTKMDIDLCAIGPLRDEVAGILSNIIGPVPNLKADASFLAITLMNINSLWHPTITYGQYRDWDLVTPFEKAPYFYEGADEFTGDLLCAESDEVLALCELLKKRYSGVNTEAVHHVREWMTRSYGSDIGDTSTLARMLNTNKGYYGLTHPMVPHSSGTGFMPNFDARYVSEDVPAGLVVTRGFAELAGMPTPKIDEVIIWCQARLGKEYLHSLDGGKTYTLKGAKDIKETRSPQRFGVESLDELMKDMHYCDEITTGEMS